MDTVLASPDPRLRSQVVADAEVSDPVPGTRTSDRDNAIADSLGATITLHLLWRWRWKWGVEGVATELLEVVVVRCCPSSERVCERNCMCEVGAVFFFLGSNSGRKPIGRVCPSWYCV